MLESDQAGPSRSRGPGKNAALNPRQVPPRMYDEQEPAGTHG